MVLLFTCSRNIEVGTRHGSRYTRSLIGRGKTWKGMQAHGQGAKGGYDCVPVQLTAVILHGVMLR
eukprot:6759876-Prymnesium_polylepis.2